VGGAERRHDAAEDSCSSNENDQDAAPPTEQATTAFEQPGETVREQDRFLPIANVAKVMKVMTRQLSCHGHAKIAHDAKMAMQEMVTEFICFVMSEANDQAVRDKRKTVTGSDIANTCRDMGEPPRHDRLRQPSTIPQTMSQHCTCALLTDLRGFYEPLSLALDFLQPVKRRRGKSSEDDPTGAKKRRRCRVSDEEYERLQLAKMVHQQPVPPLPSQDHAMITPSSNAFRPTRGVVIASPAVQFAVNVQQPNGVCRNASQPSVGMSG
jgi:histone H3/H4